MASKHRAGNGRPPITPSVTPSVLRTAATDGNDRMASFPLQYYNHDPHTGNRSETAPPNYEAAEQKKLCLYHTGSSFPIRYINFKIYF